MCGSEIQVHDAHWRSGKLNRGMSVVDTVEILKGDLLTDKEYFNSALLGWCVELLQAGASFPSPMCNGRKLTL